MSTDRYLRKPRVWVKVTRDGARKTFSFVLGYRGEVQGFERSVFGFAYVPTWVQAMELAETKTADYQ